MATDPHDDEGIIPLSRYRAQLSRARTRHRADEILDHPDPSQLVPTLPLQDLYYAIREVGIVSGHGLLALATPAQVRGFLDLDAWERDQFVPERAAPWLDALTDLGPEALLRAVAALDPEMVALWIQRQARIYDLEQEAPPDEPEGHYCPTPDSFFLLDVLGANEDGKRLERFIDWLYRADLLFARQAIMAARWELPADLEEHAYRWRSGRMADLGYVDYYEALEIYRFLDPASVRPDEGTAEARGGSDTMPVELMVQVGEASFLGRALAQVGDAAELDRLSGALLQVMNRVMSADRVEPADVDGAEEAMRRAGACIGLGLELLAKGDAARAAEVLHQVALSRVFRVGFSLTLKLQRAAEALVQHAWVSLVPGEATLLEPPLVEVLAAARRPRPLYATALDGGEGPRGAGKGERPFVSLADVARTAAALEEAAEIGELIRRGLGVEPRLLGPEARAALRTPAEAITFGTVVATLAANALLERPPALVPLSLADVSAAARALDGNRLSAGARGRLQRTFAARLAEREVEAPPWWERWLGRWVDHLEEALLVGAHHPEAANLVTSAAPVVRS